MKRKVLTAAGICIGILILTEGSRYFVQNQKCQKQLFAMDTYMEFTAYGKNSEKAVDAAIEEVQKLDAMLSAENSKSEVYALNEQGNLQATDDLAELILRGKEIYQDRSCNYGCNHQSCPCYTFYFHSPYHCWYYYVLYEKIFWYIC